MELESSSAASPGKKPPGKAWRTTRKSILLGAKQRDSKALSALCSVYWEPVYHFIRAHGISHDLALDVTQGVFANLLRRDLCTLDLERGSRFRNWLKRVARSHLLNVLKATKRVSRIEVSSSDSAFGLDSEFLASADAASQELLFDRQAALALMALAWERLHRQKYADRTLLFEHVKQRLSGENTRVSDTELSRYLGQCDCYVRGICKKVRDDEFPEALRDELRAIGVSERRMNEELRALLFALS